MTTLIKEEKDQSTLKTYEGLGDSKVQITDSTLQICHGEEAIQQKHHLVLKQYHDEVMKGH